MPAGDEDASRATVASDRRSGWGTCFVAGQDGEFLLVGRHRVHGLKQGANGLVRQGAEFTADRCLTNGVPDGKRTIRETIEEVDHGGGVLGTAEGADLDGVRGKVIGESLDLGAYARRRHHVVVGQRDTVLCSDAGDDRGAVEAEVTEGVKVRLDSGTAATVGARDGPRNLHGGGHRGGVRRAVARIGLARISHQVACAKRQLLGSWSVSRHPKPVVDRQTALATPSPVFCPPARTCDLNRSPRYAFGREHAQGGKILGDHRGPW